MFVIEAQCWVNTDYIFLLLRVTFDLRRSAYGVDMKRVGCDIPGKLFNPQEKNKLPKRRIQLDSWWQDSV